MRWAAAVHELAAAHVGALRDRWALRDRPVSLHDVVDEIVTPGTGQPPEPVRLSIAAARAAIAAEPLWRRLIAASGIGPRETEWLALLAACEINPRLHRVLGYLDDTAASVPPSPAIAAALWDWPAGWQPGPASGIARWQVAAPDGPWQSGTSWTVDCGVAAYLAGREDWARLRGEATLLDASAMACLHPELLAEMAAAVRDVGAAGCEVELVGPLGSGRRTLLAQLGAALGRRVAVLAPDSGMRGLMTARLLDAVPLWVADGTAPVGVDAMPGALTLIARTTPAVTTCDGVIRLSWAVPVTGPRQRLGLWAGVTDAPAPSLVADWDLTPADVLAGASAGPAAATRVLRDRLRRDTSASMSRLDLPYDWADLVVPGRVADALHRLCDHVVRRRDVLERWEFRRLCPTTTGVTALFAGPSGTGKTMAAQVLARRLDLDLFRVDLAAVVSKYVGETEKHLAAVFDEAERSGMLLFFDEADALFGQRTKVHDAHDRYANIEIDYLLQRLDTFRGLAILATNRKSDLDSAFLRRLRTIVDFVAPAAEERLRLWRRALPAYTSTGVPITAALDHEWLATHIDLTGADIGSIALAAAFDASANDELITTDTVLAAARRELGKRGTVLRVERPAQAVTG